MFYLFLVAAPAKLPADRWGLLLFHTHRPQVSTRVSDLPPARAGSGLRLEPPLIILPQKAGQLLTAAQLPANSLLHFRHIFKGNFQTDGTVPGVYHAVTPTRL